MKKIQAYQTEDRKILDRDVKNIQWKELTYDEVLILLESKERVD